MGFAVGGGPQKPKTTQVVGLLSYYAEEVEADILRFYPGRRIREWWRTELGNTSEFGGTTDMTSRELMVLVDQLPEESATKRAITGDDWPTLHHLVANVLDAVTFSRADYANAHGNNVTPERIKRPRELAEADAKQATARSKHDDVIAQMRGEHRK